MSTDVDHWFSGWKYAFLLTNQVGEIAVGSVWFVRDADHTEHQRLWRWELLMYSPSGGSWQRTLAAYHPDDTPLRSAQEARDACVAYAASCALRGGADGVPRGLAQLALLEGLAAVLDEDEALVNGTWDEGTAKVLGWSPTTKVVWAAVLYSEGPKGWAWYLKRIARARYDEHMARGGSVSHLRELASPRRAGAVVLPKPHERRAATQELARDSCIAWLSGESVRGSSVPVTTLVPL